MRLIDADALMEHVYRDRLDSRELIADMVKNAPTIDERKTGEWYCSDDMYETAICSCCKWDTGESWKNAVRWFNYCPHCGCQMVGDS